MLGIYTYIDTIQIIYHKRNTYNAFCYNQMYHGTWYNKTQTKHRKANKKIIFDSKNSTYTSLKIIIEPQNKNLARSIKMMIANN